MIEERITDLHMHIIPDADDGASSLAESLSLIKESYHQGITDFFATSHSFAYIDEKESRRTKESFYLLKSRLSEEYPSLNLYLGCEILCLKRWMSRIIEGLERKQYPSMNDSSYVLIEFSTWDTSEQEAEICAEYLLRSGWIPIFAHIERYYDSFASLTFVEKMRKKGCLFQINLYDLAEQEDKDMIEFTRILIEKEVIDFIGSDTHNMHHRSPKMSEGLAYLKEHCRDKYINELLYDNARRYLKI